ncbi:hypothetical protein D3C74_495290 [compost metagenome]
MLEHERFFAFVVASQRQRQVAVHPAFDPYVQPPVEVQTGNGSDDDDKVIHENPRPAAQIAEFAANVW